MKQHVIDWYNRNGFKFWKIENSTGKIVSGNAVLKDSPDENATKLSTELDSLERLGIAERYSVYAVEKNGQDWQTYPFVTYANSFSGSGGNFPFEMAMMLGKMQSEQSSQQIIWQMQREKEEWQRKEAERNKSGIVETIKPLMPVILSSVAPVAIKGFFELAGKSPQILTFLEKVTANPAVQQGIMEFLTANFSNAGTTASNGTDESTY